jgi:hypothetical protein
VDHLGEFVEPRRLLEDGRGSGFAQLAVGVRAGVPGQEAGADAWGQFAEGGQGLGAVHVGHAHVEYHRVDRAAVPAVQGQRLLAARREPHREPLPLEQGAHHAAHARLVVHDQDARTPRRVGGNDLA